MVMGGEWAQKDAWRARAWGANNPRLNTCDMDLEQHWFGGSPFRAGR